MSNGREVDPQPYTRLLTLRAAEELLASQLEAARAKVSEEVRALMRGDGGKPQRSLREIAAAVGAAHPTVFAWSRRGVTSDGGEA